MKPSVKRTTITITDTLYEKAQRLMKSRDFADFSSYLHDLIRRDFEANGTKLPTITDDEEKRITEEYLAHLKASDPNRARELFNNYLNDLNHLNTPPQEETKITKYPAADKSLRTKNRRYSAEAGDEEPSDGK